MTTLFWSMVIVACVIVAIVLAGLLFLATQLIVERLNDDER